MSTKEKSPIISQLWKEAAIASMTGKDSRKDYEAAASRLGFTPAADVEIAVSDWDFWDPILEKGKQSKDPELVAAVAYSDVRRTRLALDQMTGVIPLFKERGQPIAERRELLMKSEAAWLRKAVKAIKK